jgi:hypothetical protein
MHSDDCVLYLRQDDPTRMFVVHKCFALQIVGSRVDSVLLDVVHRALSEVDCDA